jgi:glycosyltransferase involved in cell wall biosynthesis
MPTRPKLIYLVTEDWYFLSHRLPVARAARDAGFEVVVATRIGAKDSGGRAAIEAEGFRVVPLNWKRGGWNPFAELCAVAAIRSLYRRERPDVAHHVAMKPVLEGSLAARLAGVPAVVNALTGLGYLFIGRNGLARVLGPLVRRALKSLLARGANWRVVMQNPDDLAALVARGIVRREAAVLIPGSGVDLARFRPAPEPAGTPAAALVGRMLWDKGVGELIEAARLLKARGVALRVRLAGPEDPENPAAISRATLEGWVREGVVEWAGEVKDVAALWRDTAIAVLPSYREGLPKTLLEAAAAGRPMVAADVPGCREIVRHGETGVLVPPRDARALADALERLAGDAALRRRLGTAARRLAEQRFGEAAIAAATVDLYRALSRR